MRQLLVHVVTHLHETTGHTTTEPHTYDAVGKQHQPVSWLYHSLRRKLLGELLVPIVVHETAYGGGYAKGQQHMCAAVTLPSNPQCLAPLRIAQFCPAAKVWTSLNHQAVLHRSVHPVANSTDKHQQQAMECGTHFLLRASVQAAASQPPSTHLPDQHGVCLVDTINHLRHCRQTQRHGLNTTQEAQWLAWVCQ